MVSTMKAIEYNSFMTIIKLLQDRIPSIASSYGMGGITISVAPSYPTDLTKIQKPSIIVRKVDTEQSKIGFGNVLGMQYVQSTNLYEDVYAKIYNILMQFDVVTANNTDRELFKDMILTDILSNIMIAEDNIIDLYDFTSSITSPSVYGNIKLIGEGDAVNVLDRDSTNNFYIGAIRHEFQIVQTIVPNQEYVDLSKWIKQTFRIIV